jgi:hypothetical protein
MKSLAILALVSLSVVTIACGQRHGGAGATTATVTQDGQCGMVRTTREADVFRLVVGPGEVYRLEAQDGASMGALAPAAQSRKSHCVFGEYDYESETAIVASANDVRIVVKK